MKQKKKGIFTEKRTKRTRKEDIERKKEGKKKKKKGKERTWVGLFRLPPDFRIQISVRKQ